MALSMFTTMLLMDATERDAPVRKGGPGSGPHPGSGSKGRTTMPLKQFKQSFPHLHKTLDSVARDNGMKFNNNIAQPKNVDFDRLNQQAAKLSGREKTTLAAGEERDQNSLVAAKGIGDLHRFLNNAFDGPHSKHIFDQSGGYD